MQIFNLMDWQVNMHNVRAMINNDYLRLIWDWDWLLEWCSICSVSFWTREGVLSVVGCFCLGPGEVCADEVGRMSEAPPPPPVVVELSLRRTFPCSVLSSSHFTSGCVWLLSPELSRHITSGLSSSDSGDEIWIDAELFMALKRLCRVILNRSI